MTNQYPQPGRTLVTGSASGIRYAVAKALLDKGASVAVGHISQEDLVSYSWHFPRLVKSHIHPW
jgi:NAD(P)-dependent dehydrogenase (short-subunit alcohol dehydrogenase family)